MVSSAAEYLELPIFGMIGIENSPTENTGHASRTYGRLKVAMNYTYPASRFRREPRLPRCLHSAENHSPQKEILPL